jgi:hypothetical protein
MVRMNSAVWLRIAAVHHVHVVAESGVAVEYAGPWWRRWLIRRPGPFEGSAGRIVWCTGPRPQYATATKFQPSDKLALESDQASAYGLWTARSSHRSSDCRGGERAAATISRS